MNPIDKVLNKRIELGGKYKEELVTKVQGHKSNISLIELSSKGPHTGFYLYELSPNDILYGDSNLREVMFPGDDEGGVLVDGYTLLTSEGGTALYHGRKTLTISEYHKIQSLLSAKPREYIVIHSSLYLPTTND